MKNFESRTRIGAAILMAVIIGHASCVFGAEKPEYLASFDPVKGFKPAQSDLTEVFLQLAGSLEYHGSPEPYLRHMKAEHTRIEAKYRQRFGRASKAYWPAYMSDEYFEQFAANWKMMAPKLGLEALSKRTGNLMRDAINGTRGNGTMLVEIFNRHQAKAFDALAGKSRDPANFDALKKELIDRLYLGQAVIHDEHFTMKQRDAVDFVIGIQGSINDLFAKLDTRMSTADASQIKATIISIYIDTGRAAQAELESAIVETALDRQSAAKQVSVP
jgi:hypothetical protein